MILSLKKSETNGGEAHKARAAGLEKEARKPIETLTNTNLLSCLADARLVPVQEINSLSLPGTLTARIGRLPLAVVNDEQLNYVVPADLFNEINTLIDMPKVTVKRADKVEYTLDKLSTDVWDLSDELYGTEIPLAMERKGSTNEINLYYKLDQPETQQLTMYDKHVYLAVGALWCAGNDVISARQIYLQMGGKNNPNAAQLERINDSLTKVATTRLYINNAEEARAYNYPKITYDSALLPLQRVTASVDGQIVDAAIKLLAEPPLLSFARDRHQIETINASLLSSPLSMTETNMRLVHYILPRILRAKRKKSGRGSTTIKLTTLYAKTLAGSRNQKSRLRKAAQEYMDFLRHEGVIKGYSMDEERITFKI